MNESLSWFYAWLLLLCLAPGVAVQSIIPLVPAEHWQTLAERFYPFFLIAHEPAPTSSTTAPSRIAVVNVNNIFQPEYPMLSEQSLEKFLTFSRQRGHPTILSLLPLSQFAGTKKSNEAQQIANLIRKYRKWISTGALWSANVQSSKESSIDADEIERFYIPSNLRLTADQAQWFQEADPSALLQAPRTVGVLAQPNRTLDPHCLNLLYSSRPMKNAVLSSLAKAVAWHSKRPLMSEHGFGWPPSKRGRYSSRTWAISDQVCRKHPRMSISDYLVMRGIHVYAFEDLLRENIETSTIDFSDKLVILTADKNLQSTKFQNLKQEVSEKLEIHGLSVVLADGMIMQDILWRKSGLNHSIGTTFLIFGLGLILIAVVLIFSLQFGLIFALSLIVTISFSSALLLRFSSSFVFPIQVLSYLALVVAGLSSLWLYFKRYDSQRLKLFERSLHDHLNHCNHFEDIQLNTQSVCASEFIFFKIFFLGYDQELYHASGSPIKAVEYLTHIEKKGHELEDVLLIGWDQYMRGDEKFSTAITSQGRLPRGKGRSGIRAFTAKIAITHRGERLGTIKIQAHYRVYEEHLINRMIHALAGELSTSWSRVDTLSRQRLRDYSYFMGASRKKLVEYFLPNAIVDRFVVERSITANISEELQPRLAKVALMHVDLRQYWASDLNGANLEGVLGHFNTYYQGMIEAARMVASVKLLGDKLSIFVEDRLVNDRAATAVDVVLLIGSLLARDLYKFNEDSQNKRKPRLGMALHVGEVVVGNLGSDDAIDYTIVGPEVDKVARLEEVSTAIDELDKTHSLLISTEAIQEFSVFKSIAATKIDLAAINVKVRTYTDITAIFSLSLEQLIEISRLTTLKRLLKD